MFEHSPTRTYLVVGSTPVHSHRPGATFTRALTVHQERRLLEGRHIVQVGGPPNVARDVLRDGSRPAIPNLSTAPRRRRSAHNEGGSE